MLKNIAAIGPEPLKCTAPPPLGANGAPVVVRPKIGFTNLNNIDTVIQTVFVRFFLDLYWNDPRMVGATYVPENIWRPAGCYVINQVEDMSVVDHEEQPILVDSKTGLFLWPIEFCGAVVNEMNLRDFPFDRDSIEVHVHQAESSSRDEFILRPFDDPSEEQQAVRFFFNAFDAVTEFEIQGFSRECWEQTGGNLKEYSHCLLQVHVVRRSIYYLWKLAFPTIVTTLFCFSSFFVPVTIEDGDVVDPGSLFNTKVDVDAFAERNNLAATMFLAQAALLYMVAEAIPKVSYLTKMDYFVNINIAIQFCVAVISWVSTGVFTVHDIATAATINLVTFAILLVVLVIATIWLVAVPFVKERMGRREQWPSSLGRDVPEVRYFPFKDFVNVFPPWAQGTKNTIALPPKTDTLQA